MELRRRFGFVAPKLGEKPGEKPGEPAADAQDDATLVAGAATGDAAAFRELYRRHLASVHARLTLMVGPGHERDNLLQQTFLHAFRALSRFRGDARFGTYLHRIAINVACEHLERRRRSRARTVPLEEAQLDRLVAPGASPESRASQRQELAQAFEHLGAIRPKKRIAFVLVAIQGMSLDEAAELLDANVEAVKQRVLHARKEMTARIARAAARTRPRGGD